MLIPTYLCEYSSVRWRGNELHKLCNVFPMKMDKKAKVELTDYKKK